MSGYDTHHATLAQTAGEQAWGQLFLAVVIGAVVVACVITVGLAILKRIPTRYDRDRERQQMHADRTDEPVGARVQRLAKETKR